MHTLLCASEASPPRRCIREHHPDYHFAQHVSRRKYVDSSSQVSEASQGIDMLLGVFVMLSAGILCFGCWRLVVWRRRNAREVHITRYDLNKSFDDVLDICLPRDPEIAVTVTRHSISPDSTSARTIRSISPEGTTPPSVRSDTFSPALPRSLAITPPPIYAELSIPPLYPQTSRKATMRLTNPTSFSLRCLTVIQSTFITKLQDELEVHEGETLHLLQEDEDGWCHVQRVGSEGPEEGIVPRICVNEYG